MPKNRVLAALAVLVAVSAVAVAATLPTPSQGATLAPLSASASPPSLEAFLASLQDPAAGAAAKRASGCGPNYCTQAQRDACNQQCLKHHHGPFVGLQCCSDCTTVCICGSVPIDC